MHFALWYSIKIKMTSTLQNTERECNHAPVAAGTAALLHACLSVPSISVVRILRKDMSGYLDHGKVASVWRPHSHMCCRQLNLARS